MVRILSTALVAALALSPALALPFPVGSSSISQTTVPTPVITAPSVSSTENLSGRDVGSIVSLMQRYDDYKSTRGNTNERRSRSETGSLIARYLDLRSELRARDYAGSQAYSRSRSVASGLRRRGPDDGDEEEEAPPPARPKAGGDEGGEESEEPEPAAHGEGGPGHAGAPPSGEGAHASAAAPPSAAGVAAPVAAPATPTTAAATSTGTSASFHDVKKAALSWFKGQVSGSGSGAK